MATAKGSAISYGSAKQIQSAQKVAVKTSSTTQKAVKVLVVIISGFSSVFILKILQVLRNKRDKKISPDEAKTQVDAIKTQWLKSMTDTLETAWSRGTTLGLKAVKDQGVAPSKSFSKSTLMKSLVDDTKRAIDDAEKLLEASVVSGTDTDATAITKKISLRLQMTGEAALKTAMADTMESELASPDTRKMWVSTNPREACSHCTRLNGMIRDWGEEFPHSFPGIYKLKVYGGVLLSPLRHPNCQCILVAVPKEK